jgi:hypothetical protein
MPVGFLMLQALCLFLFLNQQKVENNKLQDWE